jgi:cell division protein FtsI/penicillin-binding protein 2
MNHGRLRFIELLLLFMFVVIIGRLFYWQIFSADQLKAIANNQHRSTIEIPASRGKILASDGFPLVSNQAAYTTFAYIPDVEASAVEIAQALGPLLAPTPADIGATPSAEIWEELIEQTTATIAAKLTNPSSSWIPLGRQTLEGVKQHIESYSIKGIGFDVGEIRHYPEASMAAHVLGFVGSDGTGQPKGYFGLEGRYNFELTGRPGVIRQEKDALGKPIVTGEYADIKPREGRTLKTHLDRGLQFLVESELKEGIERYQAASGEIIVVDPKTGGILAMAALPSFDPAKHRLYPQEVYKNPAISNTYEPGSTFKTIIMAAALNEKAITPTTICDATCNGPVTIGKYTIRTWNNQYYPGQNMTDVLARSDNTGMIFVANKLGKDKLVDYLSQFGFGKLSGIDLEGETSQKFRDRWGDIDVATASFGQGLAVNSLQMIMAVAAIANEGKLMAPHIVASVIDETGENPIKPVIVDQVISKETASQITQMMVVSAASGEAQWAVPKDLEIAGKTGTAQIPIAGHYDASKTVASFIGFAPAANPRFVMIVKLTEPQSSPWASETAAPLWFSLAKEMYSYLNITKN